MASVLSECAVFLIYWFMCNFPPDEMTQLYPELQLFLFSLLDILPFTFLTPCPLLILPACPTHLDPSRLPPPVNGAGNVSLAGGPSVDRL